MAEWQTRRAKLSHSEPGHVRWVQATTMKTFVDESSSDPAVHCEHLQKEMAGLAEHLRQDVRRVNEPQFQALLETAAEVIGALRTSLKHYGEHNDPAWKASAGR